MITHESSNKCSFNSNQIDWLPCLSKESLDEISGRKFSMIEKELQRYISEFGMIVIVMEYFGEAKEVTVCTLYKGMQLNFTQCCHYKRCVAIAHNDINPQRPYNFDHIDIPYPLYYEGSSHWTCTILDFRMDIPIKWIGFSKGLPPAIRIEESVKSNYFYYSRGLHDASLHMKQIKRNPPLSLMGKGVPVFWFKKNSEDAYPYALYDYFPFTESRPRDNFYPQL
jgi:hypothetical protein